MEQEIIQAGMGLLWLLALIPFVDYHPPEQSFLPDVSSKEIFGYMDPHTGEWIDGDSSFNIKYKKPKWYGDSYYDEAGIGLVTLAIILFSKPWK